MNVMEMIKKFAKAADTVKWDVRNGFDPSESAAKELVEAWLEVNVFVRGTLSERSGVRGDWEAVGAKEWETVAKIDDAISIIGAAATSAFSREIQREKVRAEKAFARAVAEAWKDPLSVPCCPPPPPPPAPPSSLTEIEPAPQASDEEDLA